MLSITLDQAKAIALVIVVAFVVLALGSAWLMKTIMQKALTAGVLVLLAVAVWSQRTSLKDCADRVRDGLGRDGVAVQLADTQCEFFGSAVTIRDSSGT